LLIASVVLGPVRARTRFQPDAKWAKHTALKKGISEGEDDVKKGDKDTAGWAMTHCLSTETKTERPV